MGSTCPDGEVDDTVTLGTKGPGIDVVGVCRHPGFFDGDDHPIAPSELFVTNGATCDGSYRWQQAHDSGNAHAAQFWWKTRSVYDEGPDLVSHVVAAALERCGDGTLDPGEACDDGNVADGDCCSSTCVPAAAGSACASDGNLCTDDECDGAGNCGHPNNSEPCNDFLFCNGTDTCGGGSCSVHSGNPCASGTQCANFCNEGPDNCLDPNGNACDDGNACTTVDQCNGSGTCVGSSPPNCNDGSTRPAASCSPRAPRACRPRAMTRFLPAGTHWPSAGWLIPRGHWMTRSLRRRRRVPSPACATSTGRMTACWPYHAMAGRSCPPISMIMRC